ncbi:MAG: YccF domain-containing protein [Myxococcota bacterium]
MSLLGNLVWLLFGGFLSALGYILGGLAMCLTVVGIPFGIQSIKLGVATLAPFGKELHEQEDADSVLRIVFNVVWLVFAGWQIALNHLFWAFVLGITIVGLPFAKQHLKLIPMALLPLGRSLRAAR